MTMVYLTFTGIAHTPMATATENNFERTLTIQLRRQDILDDRVEVDWIIWTRVIGTRMYDGPIIPDICRQRLLSVGDRGRFGFG